MRNKTHKKQNQFHSLPKNQHLRLYNLFLKFLFLFLSIAILHIPTAHAEQNSNAKETLTLVNAYFNLAKALQDSHNNEESLEHYQKALELDPTHLPTLLGIGTLYLTYQNEYDKAIQAFEKRLKIDPGCYNSEFLLAQAYTKKNDTQLAMKHYKKSIKINPHFAQAYKHLIQLLVAKNKTQEAIEIGKQALSSLASIKKKKSTKQYVHYITITEILTDLLIRKQQFDQALVYANELITQNPQSSNYQLKKAKIFALTNQFRKAIKIFEQLSKLQPGNMKIVYNIAHLQKKIGAYEKAIHLFKQVLKTDPRHKNALLGISTAYLSLGYYKNGWRYMDQYNTIHKKNTLLTKLQDIPNKIILIKGELYPEDMIQLVRYAKLLKTHGAKSVIVQTIRQLVNLFQNCPYIDKVISIQKRETCSYNRYISISSLPHLFGTTKENIPCEIPYLYPDNALVEFWEKNFPRFNTKNPTLKVGIYITQHSGIPVSQLIEIAKQENIQVYMLNNLIEKNYLKEIPNTKIIYHFGRGFRDTQHDVSHLAAILPHFDLFITCDCLAAHLAGALGVNTLVLLPKVTDWHWICDSGDSPWYPTMKLFWQSASANTNDWQDVITNIHACLQAIA